MLHATPVTILDGAFQELCSLLEHDEIRYGDIKRVAARHGLTKKQATALRVRLHRLYHDKDVTIHARAWRRKLPSDIKPQSFDAHGRLFYSTLVLNDGYLAKLPVKNRFWRGIKHQDFCLQAFSTGRVIVYPLSINWRSSCPQELAKAGWGAKAVESFMSCLQVNGSKLELAVAIPGVPSGQHYSDKSGLVDIETDHTPKASGNVEIKVNIGQFEQKLDSIEKAIERIPVSIGGGMSIVATLNSMLGMVQSLQKEVYALKQGLGVPQDVQAWEARPVPVSQPAPSPPPEPVPMAMPAPLPLPLPQARRRAEPVQSELPSGAGGWQGCPFAEFTGEAAWCGRNFIVAWRDGRPMDPERAGLFGAFCSRSGAYAGCPHYATIKSLRQDSGG